MWRSSSGRMPRRERRAEEIGADSRRLRCLTCSDRSTDAALLSRHLRRNGAMGLVIRRSGTYRSSRPSIGGVAIEVNSATRPSPGGRGTVEQATGIAYAGAGGGRGRRHRAAARQDSRDLRPRGNGHDAVAHEGRGHPRGRREAAGGRLFDAQRRASLSLRPDPRSSSISSPTCRTGSSRPGSSR